MAKYIPNPKVIEAIKKDWKSERMIKHCISRLSNDCTLSNGHIMTFEKPYIKTSFCYGYSLSCTDSESYDRASELAYNAQNDVINFINENIDYSGIKRVYEKLKNAEKVYYNLNHYGFINIENLHNEHDECRLRCEYGTQSEMYKQYIQFELNNNDKKLIMEKLAEELQKFVKRLNTYLKKYGLSCVNSWSYWQDA